MKSLPDVADSCSGRTRERHDNVSVRAGEVTAFSSTSGSGKTTTLWVLKRMHDTPCGQRQSRVPFVSTTSTTTSERPGAPSPRAG